VGEDEDSAAAATPGVTALFAAAVIATAAALGAACVPSDGTALTDEAAPSAAFVSALASLAAVIPRPGC
jgi:hypothetical protein